MPRDVFSGKKRIACKFHGGSSKGFYYHTGVAYALDEIGFKFEGGLATEKQARYGDMHINPLIGSSAGALFATFLAKGFSPKLIKDGVLGNDKAGFKPLENEEILKKTRYIKDFLKNIKSSIMYRNKGEYSLRKLTLEDLINSIPYLLSIEPIGDYVRNGVLRGDLKFQDLAPDLFVLAVEPDKYRTVVFGKKNTGQIHDYIYKNHATISNAVAASCALFIVKPITIPEPDGTLVDYIDGDFRNPFTTNVAEDENCDLVFVSSLYVPYKRDPAFEKFAKGSWIKSLSSVFDNYLDSAHRKQERMRQRFKSAVNETMRVLKEENVSKETMEKIEEILRRKLEYKLEEDPIYITPDPRSNEAIDFERINKFTTKQEEVKFCVDYGYKRTFETLKEKDIKI